MKRSITTMIMIFAFTTAFYAGDRDDCISMLEKGFAKTDNIADINNAPGKFDEEEIIFLAQISDSKDLYFTKIYKVSQPAEYGEDGSMWVIIDKDDFLPVKGAKYYIRGIVKQAVKVKGLGDITVIEEICREKKD